MTRRDALSKDLRVLGLKTRAEWPEIQSAYRRLALELHPDLNREAPARADSGDFRMICEAYERLRKRHINLRLRARDHIDRITADPVAAELSIEELELRIRYSSSPQLRAASTLLLADRYGGSSRAVLVAAGRDSDPQVRAAAVEGLRKIGAYRELLHCVVLDGLRRIGRGSSK